MPPLYILYIVLTIYILEIDFLIFNWQTITCSFDNETDKLDLLVKTTEPKT